MERETFRYSIIHKIGDIVVDNLTGDYYIIFGVDVVDQHQPLMYYAYHWLTGDKIVVETTGRYVEFEGSRLKRYAIKFISKLLSKL